MIDILFHADGTMSVNDELVLPPSRCAAQFAEDLLLLLQAQDPSLRDHLRFNLGGAAALPAPLLDGNMFAAPVAKPHPLRPAPARACVQPSLLDGGD